MRETRVCRKAQVLSSTVVPTSQSSCIKPRAFSPSSFHLDSDSRMRWNNSHQYHSQEGIILVHFTYIWRFSTQLYKMPAHIPIYWCCIIKPMGITIISLALSDASLLHQKCRDDTHLIHTIQWMSNLVSLSIHICYWIKINLTIFWGSEGLFH